MAYNESLAGRVERYLAANSVRFEAKKMMGGLVFMVKDKMCVGVEGDRLMLRLDPSLQEHALALKGCTPMDFTGNAMRGFVWIAGKTLKSDNRLRHWIDLALAFNPHAHSSSKRARRASKSSSRTAFTSHRCVLIRRLECKRPTFYVFPPIPRPKPVRAT